MRIAICDNDPQSLERLSELIRAFAAARDLKVELGQFTRGKDLLASCAIPVAYDVIFMDIYLTRDGTEAEGIELIRRLNLPRSQQVVFTTTSKAHAIEAFGLNAAHYLVKPLEEAQVAEAMDRCIERLGKGLFNTITVKTKQGNVHIPTENIIYIEVFNKVSLIHTAKNAIQTYASLDSLFELLDEKVFMRPQRSFIVNMGCIREFTFDHLVLTGDTVITLSRNSRPELKKQYQKFLFDLARRGEI